MNPNYPVYIISKGRWEDRLRLTDKYLGAMNVPHYIVVEEQEYEAYRAHVSDLATLLILDPKYQDEYDTCDDLGNTKSKGPGPARNFVWDHSIAQGAKWHWVMDDNIRGFYRLNHNRRIPVGDGTMFYAMEEFVERYENIGMAGPHYLSFSPARTKLPPFIINRRIYSCNLIRNDMPYRWRGRYNEDTDLSLRMLKDHHCTVIFYAFLQNKVNTQSLRGGNTQEFYNAEGTMPKSKMQVDLHPDISRLVWRYERWHHDVDYSGFRQRLRRKPDVEIPKGTNEYGMVYQRKINDKWITQPTDKVVNP